MIYIPNSFLRAIARLLGAIAICCLSVPALAQVYPVRGVWVAVDDRTAGSKGGACLRSNYSALMPLSMDRFRPC